VCVPVHPYPYLPTLPPQFGTKFHKQNKNLRKTGTMFHRDEKNAREKKNSKKKGREGTAPCFPGRDSVLLTWDNQLLAFCFILFLFFFSAPC
jgi:hypothetical protein